MKKLVYLFGLCLLTAALAACSSDYDDPPEQPDSHQDEVPVDSVDITQDEGVSKDYTVISTVPVSEEVKAFFDEALPKEEGNTAYFYFDNHATSSYSYYVINNEKELRERYKGNKELPIIDFGKYSVIIAKFPVISSLDNYYLELHQYKDSTISLVFCFKVPDCVYSGTYDSHIWGLFPKIENYINRIEFTTE